MQFLKNHVVCYDMCVCVCIDMFSHTKLKPFTWQLWSLTTFDVNDNKVKTRVM